MPIFSNTPPDDGQGHALPLRRTPVGKPINAVVTCEDLIGCPTHFYKGRTQPHEERDCAACNAGFPWRWHSYLSATESGTRLHFIFETTKAGTEPFLDYRRRYGSLRGCHFIARRQNRAPNSRVLIVTNRLELDTLVLPSPPDLVRCLAIIWNIASPTINDKPINNAVIGRIDPTRANGRPPDRLKIVVE